MSSVENGFFLKHFCCRCCRVPVQKQVFHRGERTRPFAASFLFSLLAGIACAFLSFSICRFFFNYFLSFFVLFLSASCFFLFILSIFFILWLQRGVTPKNVRCSSAHPYSSFLPLRGR